MGPHSISRFASLVAALFLLGCPADGTPPEPEPEPVPEPEPEVWLLEGLVRDSQGEPLPGVELGVGDVFEVTGDDGLFEFEVPDGPPVQLDRTDGEAAVRTFLTCLDYQSMYVWQSGPPVIYPDLEIRLTSFEDLADVTLIMVYEHAEYGWISTSYPYTGSFLLDGEGGASAVVSVPPASRFVLLASEVRAAGQLAFGRVDGEEPIEEGNTLQVTLDLQEVDAGYQTWDGEAPEGATEIYFNERLEVWGRGLFLPVANLEVTGDEVEIPVLDGQLDVMEYQVTLAWQQPGCDSAVTSATLPPVFPPDVLSLPQLPAPAVAQADGPWIERPSLSWTPDPDASYGYAYLYLDTWLEDGTRGPDWTIQTEGDCGTSVSWPERLPSLESVATGSIQMLSGGSGWSSRCSTAFEL